MFSPLQHHLETNYVPTIQEVKNIKIIMGSSIKELHDIDVEIERVSQQLRLLQEQRDKMNNFLENHQALVSPARRLDRDVLQEIFLACRPENRNPCMSATEAPMLLTRICRSWRSIAQSLSPLWSAIHIVLPNLHTGIFMTESMSTIQEDLLRQKLRERKAAVMEWLERSRETPLSISVYQAPNNNGHPVESFDVPAMMEKERQLHIPFITNTLLPYSHRWYEFDICLSPQTLNALFENELKELKSPHSVPMLKKFHITSRDTRDTSDLNMNLTCLEWKHVASFLSSQLISVTLHGIIIKLSDLPLNRQPDLIWKHVRELNLDTRPTFLPSMDMELSLADIASNIIQHCQSLETLKMILFNIHDHSNDRDDSWPHHVGHITLPNLTTLSLEFGSLSFEVMGFVQHLHLPALKVLNIQLGYSSAETLTTANVLNKLLHNCEESLQSLNIHSPRSLENSESGQNIAKLLQLTPNLKYLRLLSTNLTHNRWVKPQGTSMIFHPMSPVTEVDDDGIPWQHDYVIHFISDSDICNDLWPLGKDYSDIICPQLEVLYCDPKVITGISAQGMKKFVKARQQAHHLDDRIAALRQINIFINEYRQKENSEEDQVLLGEKSAIFLRKSDNAFSPWEGFVTRHKKSEIEIPMEVYTDL
ncbi:hypothetical protein BDQ17DRAFT_1273580 [Cyathus striatus]|nr:hypothetical protein BDQ17DRAFT_1273580 [Cyathus striatus]